jgi:hypothetical protein
LFRKKVPFHNQEMKLIRRWQRPQQLLYVLNVYLIAHGIVADRGYTKSGGFAPSNRFFCFAFTADVQASLIAAIRGRKYAVDPI